MTHRRPQWLLVVGGCLMVNGVVWLNGAPFMINTIVTLLVTTMIGGLWWRAPLRRASSLTVTDGHLTLYNDTTSLYSGDIEHACNGDDWLYCTIQTASSLRPRRRLLLLFRTQCADDDSWQTTLTALGMVRAAGE